VTILLALGVGTCALSVLPERPPLLHFDSLRSVPSLPQPSTPDIDAQPNAQSGTVLEQRTTSDGLVHLMSRKRKAGDAAEHHGSYKGPGLFVIVPPMVEEEDEDESLQPDTSSGPAPTPIPAAKTPETATQGQALQPKHPGQMQEIKSPTLVTRPTHVDIPPPPELKALLSPHKPPSPSASRLPQIDITPGLQVLVVDDDKITRMLFQRMLGRLKCSVTTAVNGYEALQLITGDQNVSQSPPEEEHQRMLFLDGDDGMSIMEMEREKEENESKFAIVFLDNHMPVMTGVEMMRKLRKFGRKDFVVGVTGEFSVSFPSRSPMGRYLLDLIPWIVLGNALLPDQEEYLEAGVDYILTKPVREESVRKMLTIADERKKGRSLSGSTAVPTPSIPPLTKHDGSLVSPRSSSPGLA
jgi:CheY-like chemotaxis protein